MADITLDMNDNPELWFVTEVAYDRDARKTKPQSKPMIVIKPMLETATAVMVDRAFAHETGVEVRKARPEEVKLILNKVIDNGMRDRS